VMAATPRHTYLVATKRHARMRSLLSQPSTVQDVYDALHELARDPGSPLTSAERRRIRASEAPLFAWPLPNLHLGVSVEDQWSADLRLPALARTPAAVRWVSYEPALDAVSLCSCDGAAYKAQARPFVVNPACPLHGDNRLDWVVAGGESGPKARPSHPDWYRTVRDQCQAAGVPFHFKQWGEWLPLQVVDAPGMWGGRAVDLPGGGRTSLAIRERGPSRTFRSGVTRPMRPGDRNGVGQLLDDDTFAVRVGKGKAGRELDGRVWDEYPAAVTA
jgi:protein gp37